MWIVYVLLSEKSAIRYVGMTQDLERRLKEHNSGKSKFTSGHMPWRVIYTELFSDSKSARTREKYLKTGAGRRFLDRTLDTNPLPE
jgi:putative endonuclease